MENIEIRRSTADEVERSANYDALWAEYAAECSIPELGDHNPQRDMYRAMEAAGALHTFGAFKGGELVGVLAMLVSMNAHYGKPIAVAETYFVREKDRKTGAGLKLLSAAEKCAAEFGAVGVFISAPMGSRLAEVVPRVGYRETNKMFFKGLA